jgi:hypothetical protein
MVHIDMMQLEFSFCTVSLCNRNCNKVADYFAIHGAYVLHVGPHVFMSEAPSYGMDFVQWRIQKTDHEGSKILLAMYKKGPPILQIVVRLLHIRN